MRNAGGGGFLVLFLFDSLLGQERLETPAATRFVHSTCANNDEFFRVEETLRVHRGIAAAHANR